MCHICMAHPVSIHSVYRPISYCPRACIILRIAYSFLALCIKKSMAGRARSLHEDMHMTLGIRSRHAFLADFFPSAVPMINVSSTLPGGQAIDKVCVQCRQAQCAPNSVFCGADCVASPYRSQAHLGSLRFLLFIICFKKVR